MTLLPRTIARSAFLCATAIIASHFFRLSSSVVPFSLLPGIYILGALCFTPLENWLGWMIYLFLGLTGIPVFATPPYGGPSYIFKPTFGFLLGYLCISPLISWIAHYRPNLSQQFLLLISMLGAGLLYIPGLIYFWLIMRFIVQVPTTMEFILKSAFFPFIGGDIIKVFVAFLLARKMRKFWFKGEIKK